MNNMAANQILKKYQKADSWPKLVAKAYVIVLTEITPYPMSSGERYPGGQTVHLGDEYQHLYPGVNFSVRGSLQEVSALYPKWKLVTYFQGQRKVAPGQNAWYYCKPYEGTQHEEIINEKVKSPVDSIDAYLKKRKNMEPENTPTRSPRGDSVTADTPSPVKTPRVADLDEMPLAKEATPPPKEDPFFYTLQNRASLYSPVADGISSKEPAEVTEEKAEEITPVITEEKTEEVEGAEPVARMLHLE